MPVEDWDNIVDTMKDYEKVYCSFIHTEEIQRNVHARSLIGYKTMSSNSGGNDTKCGYFGAIAFGFDVHLSSHTNDNFGYSLVSVHIENQQYQYRDRVVAYFCFPSMGMAVALYPGDILASNPREPHAVLSK